MLLSMGPAITIECRRPFFALDYLSDGSIQMENDCLDIYCSILVIQEALLKHRPQSSLQLRKAVGVTGLE